MKYLKLGPVKMVIERIKDLREPESGRKMDGMISLHRGWIRLNKGMNALEEKQTLWHEALHGFYELSGREHAEEGEIDALAYFIIQVLQENKGLNA